MKQQQDNNNVKKIDKLIYLIDKLEKCENNKGKKLKFRNIKEKLVKAKKDNIYD